MIFRLTRRIYLMLKLRGFRYLCYVLLSSFPQSILRRVYTLFADNVTSIGIYKWFISKILLFIFILLVISGIVNGAWVMNSGIILVLIFISFVWSLLSRILKLRWMLKEAISRTEKVTEEKTFQFTTIADLPISYDDKTRLKNLNTESSEIEMGILDRDGRVLDNSGFLSFMNCVSSDEFIPKDRFQIDIVIKKGKILIKKSFGKDRASFIKEAFFLARLWNKVNVPAIWELVPHENVIYMNLVVGKSIQEILAQEGIVIRYSDIIIEPSFKHLSGSEISNIVDKIVRKNILRVIDQRLLCAVDQQLDIAHKFGIVGVYLKPGNILVQDETSTPFLIDFHTARFFRKKGFIFNLFRDQDRIKYNRKCGRKLITEKTAWNGVQNVSRKWYAPIDFGYGLTQGAFWGVESGMGRWEVFIKEYLPDLKNKRILDLGSNNGCLPLMMLKEGAAEVIGMELSREFFEQSLLVRELFQWRDMEEYAFKTINTDMYDIINSDLGRFDIITSFCTLYYLKEKQMEAVVRRASEISSLFVIQANIIAGSTWDSDKPRRASVEFLNNLLKKNGFPHVDIIVPSLSTRPLLIGVA